jgi:hypothetical protein
MATLNSETGVLRISRAEMGLQPSALARHLLGWMPEVEENKYFLQLGISPIKRLTFDQISNLRKKFPPVNSCIEFLKGRMISFPYRIKKTNGRHNNLSQKRADRVDKILQGPNQYGHTYRQIMMMWLDNLLERDLGVIEKAVNLLGGIDQIGVIESKNMKPNVVNNTGELNPVESYYEFAINDPNTIVNRYSAEQIIWANLNPRAGSFYGFSPIEVLDTIIMMSVNADNHNLKIVSPNSEKGGGIVWLGDVKEEVRKEFETRYDQFRRNDPSRPLFTGGGSEPKYLALDDNRRMEWEKLQLRISEITASC